MWLTRPSERPSPDPTRRNHLSVTQPVSAFSLSVKENRNTYTVAVNIRKLKAVDLHAGVTGSMVVP